MGFMTFKGGVHPHDGKEFSKDKPIRELLPGNELVFPVSQHIGAPASPVVAVGDTVLGAENCRGQRLRICTGLFLRIRQGEGNPAAQGRSGRHGEFHHY